MHVLQISWLAVAQLDGLVLGHACAPAHGRMRLDHEHVVRCRYSCKFRYKSISACHAQAVLPIKKRLECMRTQHLECMFPWACHMATGPGTPSQQPRHAFATISFISETFIFLYVGMDALDISKWKASSAR